MAQQYELIIRNGEGTGSVGGTSGGTTAASDTTKIKSFIKAKAIQPFINQTTAFVTNNVGLYTGSQQLQQRTNRAMELINTGSQAYSSATGGIAVANAFGMTAGAGAILGVALMGLQKGLEIMFNQAQINLERKIEARELEQTRSRAGLAFNKSRMGA